MIARTLSKVTLLAVAIGAVSFFSVPAARADLEIWVSTTDNPPTAADAQATAPSGTSATFTNASFGGFDINLLATGSNSPGTASNTQLTGSTLDIKNNNASTATLFITLGDTGFTSPTAPPNVTLDSHIGGTVVLNGAANLLTYQSYVNTSNTQNGTSGLTPGGQHPGITSGSFDNDAFLTITSLAGPYSITEFFAITLGAGSEINFSSSSALFPSTAPEPATLILLGSGLIGLGFATKRRRLTS